MRSVLSAMMRDEGLMLTALARLRHDAMVGQERHVLDALRKIAFVGGAPSPIVVCEKLREDGLLDVAGGAHGVSSILDAVGVAENLDQHCSIVNREARGRALREVCRKVLEELRVNVDSALDKAESAIMAIQNDEIQDARPILIGELLPQLLEGIRPGIKTGFWLLDWATNGLGDGWLVTVGARPGVGKTLFGLAIADNVARNGDPVMFISLEMTEKEIMQRIVARSGLVAGDAVADAALNTLPIAIVPPAQMSVVHVRAAIRRSKIKPRLVVVDYLQLVSADNPRERRYEQVDAISRDLKRAAREFSIPIIALAQVGRATEVGGKQRMPTQADLRESGGIEANADLVVMLHRPDPINTPTDAEMLIDKNRHGPSKRMCNLFFDEPRTTFYDVDA